MNSPDLVWWALNFLKRTRGKQKSKLKLKSYFSEQSSNSSTNCWSFLSGLSRSWSTNANIFLSYPLRTAYEFITKPESGKEEENEGGVNRQTGLNIRQLDKQASAKACLTELKDNGHVGISFLIVANALKRISNFRTFRIQGFSISGRQLLGFVVGVVCFYILIINFVEIVHVCTRVHVEVRRQFMGAGSLLLPCESWGSNSGCQS